MEENQHLENKFRESFNDFEQTPPESIWEGVRSVLHPEPRYIGFWARITQMPQNSRFLRISAGAVAATIILFLLFLWLAYGNHRTIRGHAYAGEIRLCRGTAYLFKVEDIAKPFDSVKHYRSSVVDDNGSYKFINVIPGKYLLRIIPELNSTFYKIYEPSWFDQHDSLQAAHTIEVKSDDLEVDVHLVAEPNRIKK